MREGRDCTLISTGNILPVALEAADRLRAGSISCGVLNMHTVKPLDEAALHVCSRETRALFTIEEHSRIARRAVPAAAAGDRAAARLGGV